jgi:hypothetical protein
MNQILENACNGKTVNQGGLNISEFRDELSKLLPKYASIIHKVTREELQKICQEELLIEKIPSAGSYIIDKNINEYRKAINNLITNLNELETETYWVDEMPAKYIFSMKDRKFIKEAPKSQVFYVVRPLYKKITRLDKSILYHMYNYNGYAVTGSEQYLFKWGIVKYGFLEALQVLYDKLNKLVKKSSVKPQLNPLQLHALSGVSLFAHYPNINGKNILLLGEIHLILSPCDKSIKDSYDVSEWLYDLVKQTHECIDLMVEIPYLKELNQGMFADYSSSLGYIINQFHDCYFQKKPENCISEKLRYHYTDLRVMDFFSVLQPLAGLSHNNWKTIKLKYMDKQIILYRYIMGYNKSDDAKQLYHSFFTDVYNLSGKTLNIDKLDNFTTTYWSIIKKEYNKLDMNDEDKNKFYEDIYATILLLSEETDPLIGLRSAMMYMDIYILLRLFIKFDTKEGRSKCPNIMKNVIIYTGSSHTYFYMEFFQLHFGVEPHYFWDKTDDYTVPRYWREEGQQCLVFEEPFNFFEKV